MTEEPEPIFSKEPIYLKNSRESEVLSAQISIVRIVLSQNSLSNNLQKLLRRFAGEAEGARELIDNFIEDYVTQCLVIEQHATKGKLTNKETIRNRVIFEQFETAITEAHLRLKRWATILIAMHELIAEICKGIAQFIRRRSELGKVTLSTCRAVEFLDLQVKFKNMMGKARSLVAIARKTMTSVELYSNQIKAFSDDK
ncbi:hypothetical protein PUMCH_000748 [Australozyma saopauloensis]|uniref:Uncharacterized protein n=1 Tax=Australozyma saopauloensis TaxID=291208 RepID=A0AAX4H4M0_9ASCO|nr:hypothetical protein PUMCH_000748 [[Candida] saopauloensis]